MIGIHAADKFANRARAAREGPFDRNVKKPLVFKVQQVVAFDDCCLRARVHIENSRPLGGITTGVAIRGRAKCAVSDFSRAEKSLAYLWVQVELDMFAQGVLLLQRGIRSQVGAAMHVMAVLVNDAPLLDVLEMSWPLLRPSSKTRCSMFNGCEDVLVALVGLELERLVEEVLSVADLLPRCQHDLLDVSGEVALRLLGDGREA